MVVFRWIFRAAIWFVARGLFKNQMANAKAAYYYKDFRGGRIDPEAFAQQQQRTQQRAKPSKKDLGGEYVDYEEVK